MPPAEWLGFRAWVVIIQFGAALLIAGYGAAAIVTLVRTHDVDRARLVVADGVIAGLSLSLAAGLLRMIFLESWEDIALFALVLGLRRLLKQLFVWEEAQIVRRRAA